MIRNPPEAVEWLENNYDTLNANVHTINFMALFSDSDIENEPLAVLSFGKEDKQLSPNQEWLYDVR